MSTPFVIHPNTAGDTAVLAAQTQRALPDEDAVLASVGAAAESGFEQQLQEQHDKLREAAQQWVSTTMIMPMFQQLRDSPLATPLFHGGRAEHIFQQQMDQMLSDRISAATNFDIVDAVYNELARQLPGGALNTNG